MSNDNNLVHQLDQLIQNEGIKNQKIEAILDELKVVLASDEVSSDNDENLIYLPMNPLIKEAKDL